MSTNDVKESFKVINHSLSADILDCPLTFPAAMESHSNVGQFGAWFVLANLLWDIPFSFLAVFFEITFQPHTADFASGNAFVGTLTGSGGELRFNSRTNSTPCFL